MLVAGEQSVSAEEKRVALEQVLASQTLARSQQLRAFLQFICEMEASGQSASVNEYIIGVKALGRDPGFSPLEDSAVRTRAYELRRRLQRYYEEESPRATVRLDLPKGSYTPRYLRFAAKPVSESLELQPVYRLPANSVAGQRHVKTIGKQWALGVAVALVLVAAGFSLGVWSTRPRPYGAMNDAWSSFTRSSEDVLICLASPLYMQITPYRPGADFSPFEPPPEAYQLFRAARPFAQNLKLKMEPMQSLLPTGNVRGLSETVSTLSTFRIPFRVLTEPTSPLTAMRGRNVMLFGSPVYSRATATLLEHMPWTVGFDAVTGLPGILGRGSAQGQNFFAQRGPHHEYLQTFGLLTVMPSDPWHDGEHTTVVFTGLTSAGTEAAAAFFSSPEHLKRLQEDFAKQLHRRWPRAWQVVLRCHTSIDSQLLNYRYETYRIVSR